MSVLEFYTERSQDCRRDAESATLPKVRERCLSAAEAWDKMADRVRLTEAYKADGLARKASEQMERQGALTKPEQS
jgi:hypothetical protein